LRKVDELFNGTEDYIERVEEDILGFNLIRYNKVYYATPKSDGAFDITRAEAGQYSRIHIGESADAVREAIHRSAQ
jgi:hypothetical protein